MNFVNCYSLQVGVIIGRGGEQIQRLVRESGAKIQMASDSGGMPERACTITGSRLVRLLSFVPIGNEIKEFNLRKLN